MTAIVWVGTWLILGLVRFTFILGPTHLLFVVLLRLKRPESADQLQESKYKSVPGMYIMSCTWYVLGTCTALYSNFISTFELD